MIFTRGIGLLILLLLYLPLTAASKELNAPKVTLKNVALAALDFNAAQIVIDLQVHNSNHTDIIVEAIRYRVALNEIDVKQGVIEQEEYFPADSGRSVRVPVALAFDQHLPNIIAALSSPVAPFYEISGTVKVRGSVILLPFNHKGQLISASAK